MPTRWCPSCGDEFRAGFERCSDCDVELTIEPPTEPSAPRHDVPHETVAYDLSDSTDEQRGRLELLLRSADVAFAWDRGELQVPADREADADDAIDSVFEEDDHPERAMDERVSTGEVRGDEIATISRRVGAVVADSVVTFIAMALLWLLVVVGSGAMLGDPLGIWTRGFTALYDVAFVGWWGRTPGKAMLGLRIADAQTANRPSWRAAIARWAVPVVTYPLVWLVAPVVGAVVGLIWRLAVYGGVFTRADRRGLHDRVAGTIVVRAGTARRLTWRRSTWPWDGGR